MKVSPLILLMVMCGVPAFSQTVTGTATTKGPCSPANSGNNNTNYIYCTGIGLDQEKKIIAMLNAALGNHNLSEINGKLDELLALASKPPPQTNVTQNCPGGICNGGNNSGTQTVNNYTPPPARLDFDDLGSIWLTPDRPITGAIIGFFFSAPVEPDFSDSSEPFLHDPNAGFTTSPQFSWGALITKDGQIPNAYVMKLSNPQIFMPDTQLVITFKGRGKLLKICNMSQDFKCLTTTTDPLPGLNPMNRVKP